MQTIPDIDGSEIIIETTGNQFGDEFHQLGGALRLATSSLCQSSCRGRSIRPHRTKLPDGFTLSAEEQSLAALHNLDAEQMCWRRNKISQLGSEDYFKREYPISPDEAFMASQFDFFVTGDLVMRARKETDIEAYGALLIGV